MAIGIDPITGIGSNCQRALLPGLPIGHSSSIISNEKRMDRSALDTFYDGAFHCQRFSLVGDAGVGDGLTANLRVLKKLEDSRSVHESANILCLKGSRDWR